jgi:hypothetical protein
LATALGVVEFSKQERRFTMSTQTENESIAKEVMKNKEPVSEQPELCEEVLDQVHAGSKAPKFKPGKGMKDCVA